MILSKKRIAIFLVLAGAGLSVVSVLMYDQVIGKSSNKIKKLEHLAMQKDKAIKGIWQTTLALENKKNIALLMLLVKGNKHSLVNNFIKDNLGHIGIKIDNFPKKSNLAFFTIISKVDKKKNALYEQINNIYLKKIELQEEILELKHKIKKLSNLALFEFSLFKSLNNSFRN